MYDGYKKSLTSLSCALTLSLLPMTFANLSAVEANNSAASVVAERGGGGGERGGGERGMGGHAGDYHSDYHPAARDNYHPNTDYNRNSYNNSQIDRDVNNQFDRDAWNRDGVDAAEWGGALDVAPVGEYVYPGNAGTPYTYPNNGGSMNTLYDYESSTNQSSPE